VLFSALGHGLYILNFTVLTDKNTSGQDQAPTFAIVIGSTRQQWSSISSGMPTYQSYLHITHNAGHIVKDFLGPGRIRIFEVPDSFTFGQGV